MKKNKSIFLFLFTFLLLQKAVVAEDFVKSLFGIGNQVVTNLLIINFILASNIHVAELDIVFS